MTDDMAQVDATLRAAWDEFCDELKGAGQLVFDHDGPANEVNRASGFEYLTRYIPKAIDFMFNYRDPLHPQLFLVQHPLSKSFGDNPDCTYFGAWIDGDRTYRLVGNRGSAKWVNFNVGPGDPEEYKKDFGRTINYDELVTNWDGSFEVVMSPDPHPGNWLQTYPGMNRVYVRQFFGNWDIETPMTLRIELVEPVDPPPPPTADDVARRLRHTVRWLRQDSEQWSKMVKYFRQWPNTFVEGLTGFMGGNAGVNQMKRTLWFCQWNVEPDEALVITVTPPECYFWNFEFSSEWMISMDYRYRISSINDEQAVLEDDGSVVIVVSHVDPGVPNWLDCAGHTSGLINQRWVETEASPGPEAKLVKLADLEAALPAGARRIDAAGRAEQLRRRKVGVDRRFPV